MSWQGIHGHDAIVQRFQRAVAQDRLGSAYLLTGPSGVGKRQLAHRLAAALLCHRMTDELIACGSCDSCRPLRAGAHPDLTVIACPEDRQSIPLELLIGDREHRSKEGLCYWINLAPVLATRKIAIIEDADLMAPEGANALLKTLEEPPPGSVLFLISHNLQRQLPTIRSRCQKVFCSPLDVPTLTHVIQEQGLVTDRARAEQLASLSAGSLDSARELVDPAWEDFLASLDRILAAEPLDGVALAKEVAAFVEEAGDSSPPKRERLSQVLRIVAERFRRELEHSAGQPVATAFELQREWLRRLDHTLDAMQHIPANAHLTTLIAAWAESLAGPHPAPSHHLL